MECELRQQKLIVSQFWMVEVKTKVWLGGVPSEGYEGRACLSLPPGLVDPLSPVSLIILLLSVSLCPNPTPSFFFF